MNELTSTGRAAGDELLAELADDFAGRYRRGERPSLEEYAQKHPGLAEQIRELFPAMLVMEQQSMLDRTLDSMPAAERAGMTIGRYKLLERIGEGGFGVVFMAEQQHPVRRKVALKVIKAGMDSRQVIARFEAERQALALMDHENIAKVLDAGATEAGRPYFVMELVRGVPITEYCDKNQLPPRQRLELFVRVCGAVQHAHTKGVIHRDIKPTNVLVTMHDGVAVPKVIDFGVAKATGQQLTEKTLFTQFAQMVGTPLYMSPEQAEMSGLDVDTRSDVYSLGVLLYELLTGTTPLDRERLKQAALDEVRRIIREEEPPRPSTRLSTDAAVPSITAGRGQELRRLSGTVRGELDWIVMKALEKDRNRRYETANGLAADVRRYLNDEAVQACPPTLGYRLRRILRRHKGPVLAASLVVLALVGGIIGTTWGLIRATSAEADAVNEAKQKQDALLTKEAALTAAKKSKREADEKLFESYLGQARGIRLSKRSGQRFESLEILKRALDLARALDLPVEKFHELRNGVIASLALPDLYLTGPWTPWPTSASLWDFDEAHTLYARTDLKGNCSVRRVADDAELHLLPGLGEPAIPFLSRDGKFLAVVHIQQVGPAYKGVALHLWTLADGTARKIDMDQGTEQYVRRVAFHPNGHQVALAYNDGGILLLELPSGRQLGPAWPPDTLKREIEVALHPKDPLLAVCSYFSPVVQIRDVRTGKVVASLPQAAGVSHAVWSPDGESLAVGAGEGGLIRLYDRTTLQQHRTLQYSSGGGLQLAFNHAGDRLMAIGWETVPELFDVGTCQKLFATTGSVWQRFSRDDQRLAGAVDGKVGVWQVGDSREYRKLVRQAAPQPWYRSVALHGDGRLLAAGMTGGFGLWDLVSGSELAFVPMGGGTEEVWDLHFEPTGALLTASESGLLRWPVGADPKTPERLSIGPPRRLLPPAHCIDQSQDGRVLVASRRAVGAALAGGWILHADRPEQPIRLDAGADISYIAVSPNGLWVVTVTQVGLAKVWDARDGRLVKVLATSEAVYPCFSPDSLWLSTYADGGRVFAVGAWEPGPRVGSWGVFAPDSQLMAVQPSLGVIRLVDRASGREFARLEDPEFDETRPLFFTPKGDKLIGLGNKKDKAIRVWDLRLIRQHLKTMGLDWDRPELPPGERPGPRADPPKVSVVGAELVVDWTVWRNRAISHANAKRWDEAVASFSKVLELNPDDAHGWNQRGIAYSWLGQKDKAVADFAKAIALKAAEPAYWGNRGSVYGQLNQHDKAIADFSKAIELKPDDDRCWNLRGVAYSRLGHKEKALADYSTAVDLKPKEPLYWSNRGFIHAELGQHEKAVADYSKAIELKPDNASYWNGRGNALHKLEQWDKAVADYCKAIELKPENAASWSNRGNSHAKVKQWDRAIADFSKAIELKPDESLHWSNRGSTYAELSQWKEAIADFAQAIELKKDDPLLWYRQALARLQRGDVAEYRKLCADMLGQLAPAAKTDSAQWIVWTCVLAADAVTDWKAPLQLAEKAVADNPKNYRALNHHGAVLYRAGQYQEALKRLTEAEAAYQPDDMKRYAIAYNSLFLAMAHHRQGHVEEAKKWHDKAVQGIDQEMPKTPKEPAAANPLPWNWRLTLQLLRREAEELLKQEIKK